MCHCSMKDQESLFFFHRNLPRITIAAGVKFKIQFDPWEMRPCFVPLQLSPVRDPISFPLLHQSSLCSSSYIYLFSAGACIYMRAGGTKAINESAGENLVGPGRVAVNFSDERGASIRTATCSQRLEFRCRSLRRLMDKKLLKTKFLEHPVNKNHLNCVFEIFFVLIPW